MKKGIVFFLVAAFSLCALSAWGNEVQKKATADVYVDLVTMHRYVKNADGNYAEYCRKGTFIKTVPAELPLLTSRSHVKAVPDNCYLLYVKKQSSGTEDKMVLKTLPDPHPEGWFLEKALVDVGHNMP